MPWLLEHRVVLPSFLGVCEAGLQVGGIVVLAFAPAHQELGLVRQGEGHMTPSRAGKVGEVLSEVIMTKELDRGLGSSF